MLPPLLHTCNGAELIRDTLTLFNVPVMTGIAIINAEHRAVGIMS
jgi:hypothetical protein